MKRSALIGGIAVAAALTMAAPAPAFAGPVQIIPWEDSDSVVVEVGQEGWCPPEIVDFDVVQSWEASGIDRITTGPDGIVSFAGTFERVDTYTANDKTLVTEAHGNTRDHKIVDNGDGTLTIWFKDSVQTSTWLDGEFLFHDSGLVEGAFLIDYNGTLSDPEDDTFLGIVEDAELHGRFDTGERDFCEDIATFLGP
ncbi:hypothetical protein J7E25_00400 [Agromyces sp. ISL-38]|uniref:hypothetical protein n=1 Tax=Agromyces sp. ISL-38 TaxID=2819107 RepID=UPI001BE99007|nr:hypothetical protein [Agromyces sp. ISL-38]MBT2497551.1 hypothetical protein [Agromyces sp. ISL-38]MBT2517348.1 hypothetical protein [Streptomyces sp. ISL-90]